MIANTKFKNDGKNLLTNFGNARQNRDGYWVINSKEHGHNGKYLHRLIFEDFYQVSLLPNTIIHHIDGNPRHNTIDNLQAMTQIEHIVLHHTGSHHQIESFYDKSSKNQLPFRVYCSKSLCCKKNFFYRYRYLDDETKKQFSISATDIYKLHDKVIAAGLPWDWLDFDANTLDVFEFGKYLRFSMGVGA